MSAIGINALNFFTGVKIRLPSTRKLSLGLDLDLGIDIPGWTSQIVFHWRMGKHDIQQMNDLPSSYSAGL